MTDNSKILEDILLKFLKNNNSGNISIDVQVILSNHYLTYYVSDYYSKNFKEKLDGISGIIMDIIKVYNNIKNMDEFINNKDMISLSMGTEILSHLTSFNENFKEKLDNRSSITSFNEDFKEVYEKYTLPFIENNHFNNKNVIKELLMVIDYYKQNGFSNTEIENVIDSIVEIQRKPMFIIEPMMGELIKKELGLNYRTDFLKIILPLLTGYNSGRSNKFRWIEYNMNIYNKLVNKKVFPYFPYGIEDLLDFNVCIKSYIMNGYTCKEILQLLSSILILSFKNKKLVEDVSLSFVLNDFFIRKWYNFIDRTAMISKNESDEIERNFKIIMVYLLGTVHIAEYDESVFKVFNKFMSIKKPDNIFDSSCSYLIPIVLNMSKEEVYDLLKDYEPDNDIKEKIYNTLLLNKLEFTI